MCLRMPGCQDSAPERCLLRASSIAGPWIGGAFGANELVEARHRFGRAVVRSLESKFASAWNDHDSSDIINLIQNFERSDASDGGKCWGPELHSLLEATADSQASFEAIRLRLEAYLIRATACDFRGRLSMNGSHGFGTLGGVPLRQLRGTLLERVSGEYRVIDSDPAVPVPSTLSGIVQPATYTGTADGLIAEVARFDSVSTNACAGISADVDVGFREAVSVICRAAIPLPWIFSAITTLYFTQHDPRSFRTGSWDRQMGVSYSSRTVDPYLIAESLLHEACHQNFYLGNLDGALEEDDGISRISPVVALPRPLWAILLAYHAFANVSIFFARLDELDSDRKNQYIARNIQYAHALEMILIGAKLTLPRAIELFRLLRAEFHDAVRLTIGCVSLSSGGNECSNLSE